MPRLVPLFCILALAACGSREPLAPPRATVPVLVYRDVAGTDFAGQMERLDEAGYETITLPTFIRFLRGERVSLPPRPFVLTFDDGRTDLLSDADPALRSAGFEAVLFADVGRIEGRARGYLRWEQVRGLLRSGRWDIQMESGSGKFLMRYGPARTDVGPFYAYRGTEEILGGWRERVFGDVSWGEKQLAFHVPGYKPLAVAPPYGNYGQAGTNDPEIPKLLFERLHLSFPLVFTQDRPPFAVRGSGTAGRIGRLEITGDRDPLDLLIR